MVLGCRPSASTTSSCLPPAASAPGSRRCGAESAFRAGLELLPDGPKWADEIGVVGEVSADHWLGGRQYDRVSVILHNTLNVPTSMVFPGQDDVRADGHRQVLPLCAFIKGWIDKHPDYADLVAA